MKQINDFRIPYQKNPDLLPLIASQLGISSDQISSFRVLKRSLDARNRRQLFWVYSIDVFFKGEVPEKEFEPFPKLNWKGPPPLILGAGPAGMFAAWTFLQHGIRPILFERGERTHARMLKISQYWRKGLLDLDSNVCNGEGGAGTFSDGKLITRIKSPLIRQVMQTFVEYGAPPEISYVYNPHVGSNLIREVIKKMTDDLIHQGAQIHFNTKVESLELQHNKVQGVVLANGKKIEGSGLILACGHSAGDFFKTLYQQGVHFEPKSFALGLRIEHPQKFINEWQYGDHAKSEELETAQYKLQTYWEKEEIGAYTFCMCPGGYVISSSTDLDAIVVNGMSNYHRNSPWANAAVVCTIPQEKISGNDPFKMMAFQREIENRVYQTSAEQGDPKKIPAQRLEDFLMQRKGEIKTKSSAPSGIVSADLSKLLPDWIYRYLSEGLTKFDQKRKGFAYSNAILHAVESRTSSPVRITRDEKTFESINTEGLFPCGEGPGYAGGITSAAVDGIRSALAWIEKFKPRKI